ncbi:unnamed protein product, partial [Amoebophrya sp. A25]
SRSGWCPGSVNTGSYLDVSESFAASSSGSISTTEASPSSNSSFLQLPDGEDRPLEFELTKEKIVEPDKNTDEKMKE